MCKECIKKWMAKQLSPDRTKQTGPHVQGQSTREVAARMKAAGLDVTHAKVKNWTSGRSKLDCKAFKDMVKCLDA